jgi:hypothetical protein
MNKPPCRKCGRFDEVKIRYDIKADKTKQFFWHCDRCNCLAVMGIFLPHCVVLPHIDALSDQMRNKFWAERIRNDYSTETRCCVCGETGAQLHHFAPRSLADYFGNEWHSWPTVYLCQEHHRQWHEIVTWYMPGYKQRRDEFLQKYYEAVGV